MIENFRHISATIHVQDYFLELGRYLLPEGPRLKFSPLSQAKLTMQKPMITFDMERLTTLNMHLTTNAFLMLMDMVPPDTVSMQYPVAPRSALPQRLCELGPEVVVITSDYTALSRQWPSVHINTLARRLRAQGLTPVLLGRSKRIETGIDKDPIIPVTNAGVDASLFVDLRDKTSLIEALGVMQRAKAVVGVDNGLLHLAHCTDVPIVYGFTTLLPQHRVPFRKQYLYSAENTSTWRAEHGLTEVLEAQVPCGGCQSRGFAVNNDWRTCLFGDYACTLTLTADRFMTSLKKLGVTK